MSIRPRLSRLLQLDLRAETRVADAELPAADAPAVSSFVELTIYADDSVASGCLALNADRLTDLMNRNTEFEFRNAFLESLEDGHGLTVETLVVERDEIFAVAVAGSRGDPGRRSRTRPIPVELRVGRYTVSGHIHAVPGANAITGFRHRSPMIPLTEATIEFDAPEGRRVARYATILVNRDLTETIAPATLSDVRPPELLPGPQDGRLAKDFTPELALRDM